MKELVKKANEKAKQLNLSISNQQMYELVSAMVDEKDWFHLNQKLKTNTNIKDLLLKVKNYKNLQDFCKLEGVHQAGVCLKIEQSFLKSDEKIFNKLKRALEKLEAYNQDVEKHNKSLFNQSWERVSYDLESFSSHYKKTNGDYTKRTNELYTDLQNKFNCSYSQYSNKKIDFCHVKIDTREFSIDIKRTPQGIVDGIKTYIKSNTIKQNKEKKFDKLFKKAIILSTSFGIDATTYEDNEKLIQDVSEKAENKYIQENFPEGTELNIDCCDHCDTWIVGEKRCSCENRRMYFEIDGNLLDGFNAYPMAD